MVQTFKDENHLQYISLHYGNKNWALKFFPTYELTFGGVIKVDFCDIFHAKCQFSLAGIDFAYTCLS